MSKGIESCLIDNKTKYIVNEYIVTLLNATNKLRKQSVIIWRKYIFYVYFFPYK